MQVRDISVGGGSKIRTPRWDDCSGVFNRRYTYEIKNKEQVWLRKKAAADVVLSLTLPIVG